MKKHNRIAAFVLSLLMVLTSFIWPGQKSEVKAMSASDFDVNTPWVLNDVVT